MYTDINVAYGKTVTYTALDTTRTVEVVDTLMTDALVDSEDPVNTADCPSLTRNGGAYLSVNLGESLPVRVVGIFGKKGKCCLNQFPNDTINYKLNFQSRRRNEQFNEQESDIGNGRMRSDGRQRFGFRLPVQPGNVPGQHV
jgi:hypothetical protein